MSLRADVRLVRDGLAESREKARRLILAGMVFAGGRRIGKPSQPVEETDELMVPDTVDGPVGRGALKLERALAVFGFPVQDRVFVDIGASTGGFTQCLLKHGARLVFAVDVGHGQLHRSLRADPRVRVMEGVNARLLRDWDFDPPPDAAVMDVSFISALKIAPALRDILPLGGELIALIKPQYEAGPGVARKGVISDPAVHRRVLGSVVEGFSAYGFAAAGLEPSPIRGRRGNAEFLLLARRAQTPGSGMGAWEERISALTAGEK
jgi:23S rRNA (cytidine1920-2'-O)/16S rRNA (cytidine1409-2'-O)-methyltransferase